MNAFISFFIHKRTRRLLYLFIIGFVALAGFLRSGETRRTFIFYDMKSGEAYVEERMLPRSSVELALRRYVEDVLFGPRDPALAPLFPRETKLRSLLYRDDVVYIDFSEDAALPLQLAAGFVSGTVFQSLATLQENLARNFSLIKGIRLFIEGHEVEL